MAEQIPLLDRLKRLQKFADLLQQEIAAIVHELAESSEQTIDVGLFGSVPFSAKSNSLTEEELATMLAEADAVEVKPVALVESETDTRTRSLLLNYLSPGTALGGKGFIKATDDLEQYSEDVMLMPSDTLSGYPTGFYRDSVTMQEQFLIKLNPKDGSGEGYTVCIGNLSTQNQPLRILAWIGKLSESGMYVVFNERTASLKEDYSLDLLRLLKQELDDLTEKF
jgi:hypothetical protein